MAVPTAVPMAALTVARVRARPTVGRTPEATTAVPMVAPTAVLTVAPVRARPTVARTPVATTAVPTVALTPESHDRRPVSR